MWSDKHEMYNVHPMKRYTVATLRERLAEALDAADRGTPVIIERFNTRYRLQAEASVPRTTRPRRGSIEILDPAVAGGDWQWRWTAGGLRFSTRRRKP